ncbi:hypothetical protein LOTGIDRAFT_167623 [Lottia gigantea]|uniref:IgGFc-binding protein N-terminal domain-containing protein n=1 Tax=Lottia gigantea TaxID=225164 RepID=V3ZNJ5_LOTGI|nr:hypothetical protein LOTGIDRAFT_167623 [Lottia gigantea]ESO85872.1 hypothetical protein LOTGIDRAFT_167623 [Lottia gigantea]
MECHVQVVFLCLVFFIPAVCSNPGKEFLLAFPQNLGSGTHDMDILITSVVDSNLTVILTFNAPPDFAEPSSVQFTLSPKERYEMKVSNTLRMSVGNLKENKSMTIWSSEDIIVQVFNKHNSNGDAYLALPVDIFGTEFYSVNYEVTMDGSASYLVVVAWEDDTTVTIRLPIFQSDIELHFEGRYYGSGETVTIQLSAKEVFQLQISADLTGSHITSNRPVFTISGQNRTTVLHKTCKSHMMDVLPPLGSVSTEYVTVSYPDIGAFYRDDMYRIISTSVNTTVTIGGTQTITLDRDGDFYDLFVSAFVYNFVHASKPIYVTQMSSSYFNHSARFGDPSLMILTPLQAKRSSYIFSSMKYTTYRVFITIVIDESSSTTLHLDGAPFTTQWYPVTGKPSLVVGMVEINQIDLVSHHIHHPDGVAFLAYLQAGETCEAYALPLGYYVTSSPKPCEESSTSPGDGLDNNCNGEVDEEVCCIRNGESGMIYYNDVKNRDCLAPAGYTTSDIICCGENNQQYLCRDGTQNQVPQTNTTLENNFFPSLFSEMVLEAGSNPIETIKHPGEIDTMLKTVLYPKDFDSVSGWIPDVGDGSVLKMMLI